MSARKHHESEDTRGTALAELGIQAATFALVGMTPWLIGGIIPGSWPAFSTVVAFGLLCISMRRISAQQGMRDVRDSNDESSGAARSTGAHRHAAFPRSRRKWRLLARGALALIALAALAGPLLQLIPLPGAIVANWAPLTFRRSQALAEALLIPVPQQLPLSLAPGKTWGGVLWGLVGLGAYMLGSAQASTQTRATRAMQPRLHDRADASRYHRAGDRASSRAQSHMFGVAYALFPNWPPLAMMVVLNSLLVAFSAAVHLLADAPALYWIPALTPHLRRPVPGPFVSPNTLAGFLLVALPLLTHGILCARRGWVHLVLWLALALHLFVIGLTASNAAFPLAAAAIGMTLWLWRKRRRAWGVLGALVLSLSALTLPLASLALGPGVLGATGAAKLLTMRIGVEAAWTQPWVGLGRQALADFFPKVALRTAHVTHSENIAVEWIAGQGIPLGAGAALGFLLLLLCLLRPVWSKCIRTRTEAPQATHWLLGFGIALLLLHNLADFSLESLGIAALFFCICGAAFQGSQARARRWFLDDTSALGRILRITAPASLALVIIGVTTLPPVRGLASVRRARTELPEEARLPESGSGPQTVTALVDTLRRHPSDAPLVLRSSEAFIRRSRTRASAPDEDQDRQRGLQLAAYAGMLAPEWPGTARWLLRLALAEGDDATLAHAVKVGSGRLNREDASALCAEMLQGPKALARFLQALDTLEDSETAASWADNVARCSTPLSALTLRADSYILRRLPNHGPATLRRATRWIRQGNGAQAAYVAEQVLPLTLADPLRFTAYLNALEAAFGREAALQRAQEKIGDQALASRQQDALIDLAIRADAHATAEELLDRVSTVGITRIQAARIETQRARLAQARGFPERALTHLRRAAVLDKSPGSLIKVIRRADSLGAAAHLREACRQLASLSRGALPEACKSLDG